MVKKVVVLILSGLVIIHILLLTILSPGPPNKNETGLATSSNRDPKAISQANITDSESLNTKEYFAEDRDKMVAGANDDKVMNLDERDSETINEDQIHTKIPSYENDQSVKTTKFSSDDVRWTKTGLKAITVDIEETRKTVPTTVVPSKMQPHSRDMKTQSITEATITLSKNALFKDAKVKANSIEMSGTNNVTSSTIDERLEAAVVSGATQTTDMNSSDTLSNTKRPTDNLNIKEPTDTLNINEPTDILNIKEPTEIKSMKDERVEVTGAVTSLANSSTMSSLSKQTARLPRLKTTKTLKTLILVKGTKGNTKESNSDLNGLDPEEYNDGDQLIGDNRDGDIDMGQFLEDYDRGHDNETVTNQGDKPIA